MMKEVEIVFDSETEKYIVRVTVGSNIVDCYSTFDDEEAEEKAKYYADQLECDVNEYFRFT